MTERGTRLGPLTTTFILPPQCTVGIAAGPYVWLGQFCPKSGNIRDATNCWPPTDRSVSVPPVPLAGWGYYSPGIQCPGGHTSACSATAGIRGGFPFQFSLAAQETAVGCCPIGFLCTLQEFNWQTCLFDSAKSSAEIQTVTCDTKKGESGGLGILTMPQPTRSVWAPMFQMNFQSTDLPAIVSSTSITDPASSPSQSAPTSVPADSASPGVSTGAIAGIAVGAVVIILAILGAVFFVWRRKRAQHDDTTRGDVDSAQDYTALGTYSQGQGLQSGTGANGMQEGKYYYSGVAEADGNSAVVEADSRSAVVEADATPAGQDAKYYYSGVGADGRPRPAPVEAPGSNAGPMELPA